MVYRVTISKTSDLSYTRLNDMWLGYNSIYKSRVSSYSPSESLISISRPPRVSHVTQESLTDGYMISYNLECLDDSSIYKHTIWQCSTAICVQYNSNTFVSVYKCY